MEGGKERGRDGNEGGCMLNPVPSPNIMATYLLQGGM